MRNIYFIHSWSPRSRTVTISLVYSDFAKPIYSKMLIEMLIKRKRNYLWNRTVRGAWTSAPNVQAVRRVLTAPRSVELFGFPPIPCHSMRLHPPRMHPYLVRKKVIHCKTRHRIITRNGTSASNEEGGSYNSTEFRYIIWEYHVAKYILIYI